MQSLPAIKTTTKEEILKRINTGKAYIDNYFLQNPEIRLIAMESTMSEFHFYRCFKLILGISPYQYMLDKRLQYSYTLLKEGQLLISAIARECGFPDVFTFSKAFKRKYGLSPSKYRLAANYE